MDDKLDGSRAACSDWTSISVNVACSRISNLLDKRLNEEEREGYLEQIKKDIAYYRRSFGKADMAVDIHGLDAAQSAEKIELALRDWRSLMGNAPGRPSCEDAR